jgi:hypothetical protein
MHVFTDFYQSLIVIFLGNAVYPCAYREHSANSIAVHQQYGLSLCIQGTPRKLNFNEIQRRFIPVHTGNTLIITICFIIKILG